LFLKHDAFLSQEEGVVVQSREYPGIPAGEEKSSGIVAVFSCQAIKSIDMMPVPALYFTKFPRKWKMKGSDRLLRSFSIQGRVMHLVNLNKTELRMVVPG